MHRYRWFNLFAAAFTAGLALLPTRAVGQESPYIYGIHDHDTGQQEWLDRLNAQGVTGWVTATLGIGHDPNNHGGGNFTTISSQGHTVIARLNNGYGTDGTIPPPSQYANFAQRCANYVAASTGCNLWIIGNETNLASEWPAVGGYRSYVSPQDYANCFRQCYNAIKAVRPGAKVICQALAPWAGPYGGAADHDAQPLGWTTYMNQMLTAIAASGGLDGIAVHINSRGYTHADVYSTAKVNGQYFSFYVYKDWVNLGTPASLRTLPYYATECNGAWYWKGGHAECGSCSNPSCCYQNDWIEWIYQEINAWNQAQAASGQGIYRCVNMYRWCSWCDGWNIDGSPQKGQILADLDTAAAAKYRWDTGPALPPVADFIGSPTTGNTPLAVTFTDQSTGQITSWAWTFGDGGTSTNPSPSYTYLSAGTYTVALTVTGPGGNNTKTRTNYITASTAPPGSNLITNGTFDTSLTGWNTWIQRNTTNDFAAAVTSGELRTTGTNYNAGPWQQFSTGGAGKVIAITGTWRSNPTVAEYQWAEVRIINGTRTPVNGVDEGGQADSILIYKNDTWATPAGWNGSMAATAPVANFGQFTSTGNVATILLKSGNLGGPASGIGWDNIVVRDTTPVSSEIIIESRAGGQNHAWYSEEGVWADVSLTSGATGITPGIGSRYGSTYYSVAGLKTAVFMPNLAASGQYRVYATWPPSAHTRSPILYSVTHASGNTEIDVDQTQNANTWHELGTFNFAAGTAGSVRISNQHIDVSGNMYASAVKFVRLSELVYSKADFDRDSDVDLDDFGHIQSCLTGPEIAQTIPACQDTKLDGDADVDQADLTLFTACFSGADISASTSCPP